MFNRAMISNEKDDKGLLLGLIYSLIIINAISLVIYIFLIIISIKKYTLQPLFVQLKLDLVISSLIHQISFTPLFTLNKNSSKVIYHLCYGQTFLNTVGSYSTKLFGFMILIILDFMFIHSEQVEKYKTRLHLLLSFLIWDFSLLIAFLMIYFGNIDFYQDSICSYQDRPIFYADITITLLILIGIFFSYFLLSRRIKQLLTNENDR